jgi:large subunit ribosomal protein L15
MHTHGRSSREQSTDCADSFSVEMSPINLNRIQEWINAGRLDPTKPITMVELNSSRCLHGVKDGVKLLARGKEELTTPINIIVSRASAEAIEAVEKLGGTVTTRFYSPFAIRKVLSRQMHPIHSLQSRIQMAPAGPEGAEAVAEAMVVDRKKYPFRLPDPTSRKDLEYYRDAHGGGGPRPFALLQDSWRWSRGQAQGYQQGWQELGKVGK